MGLATSFTALTLSGQIEGCAMSGLPFWYGVFLACILLYTFVVDFSDRGGQRVQYCNAASFRFKLG